MRDSTAEAERVRLAAVRCTPPVERMRAALELSETVRRLAFAGLRQRHPRASDIELVEVMLGRSLLPAAAARTVG